jgi:hypothetical protein
VQTVTLHDTMRGVWFNTSADPLADGHIRRALRDSIQWDSVDAYLTEHGEAIAHGYVPPAATVDGAPYHNANNALPRVTDATAAAKHLQAGLKELYPDGGGNPGRAHLVRHRLRRQRPIVAYLHGPRTRYERRHRPQMPVHVLVAAKACHQPDRTRHATQPQLP